MSPIVRNILFITFGALALSACEKQGPAEEAGESIDNAVEDAGASIEDATDEVGGSIEEAGDRMN